MIKKIKAILYGSKFTTAHFFFFFSGIQGFARICAGDIFEVVLKHGSQKWKSRGRVMKNGEQLWENKFMLFKALFSEALCIKVSFLFIYFCMQEFAVFLLLIHIRISCQFTRFVSFPDLLLLSLNKKKMADSSYKLN